MKFRMSLLAVLSACSRGYESGRPARLSLDMEGAYTVRPRSSIRPPAPEVLEPPGSAVAGNVAPRPAPAPAVAYVPSALQGTPPAEIEIVSQKQLDEYEVVVWEEPSAPAQKTIRVVKGDTLYSLAKKYDVKVYDLAEQNNMKAPFVLKVGGFVKVPDPSRAKQARPAATLVPDLDADKSFIEEPYRQSVEVKKGDTLYSIARANGVPLRDLIEANGISPPYSLSPGQRLNLPATAFHIASKGDTLYGISRRYGVNLKSLAVANGIKPPYSLSVGQKIVLPASTGAPPSGARENVIVKKDGGGQKVVAVDRPRPSSQGDASGSKDERPAPVLSAVAPDGAEGRMEKPGPLSGKGSFLWPVDGKVISGFGVKSNGNRNDGVNIAAPLGAPVLSAENGVVVYAGNELRGLGNLIILKHSGGYMTIYAHNGRLLVKKGARVSRGDKIAEVGKTGRVLTPQLHFEIRQKTKSLDPTAMLDRA
ncbi:MAG: LysM peptidoglycan-binding domain-containing protein [Rickettsiales bacterium]|nr:LysM peptidoglycan-binding domain-containing protein [Rickettsiales bacterium]